MAVDHDELTADIAIDPANLDIEAIKMTDLFYKWAERAVEAKSKADAAEVDLKGYEAQLQIRCRDWPQEFGLTNITEAGVKAAVLASTLYRERVETTRTLTKEAAKLTQAVAAMDMKRKMIDNMVKLHGQQYFSGPEGARDLVAVWQAQQRNTEQNLINRQLSGSRRVNR